MTPTQEQIEAAALAMYEASGKTKDWNEIAIAALTAAAEVGEFPEPTSEQIEARWSKKFADAVESIKRKERERCAQVVENFDLSLEYRVRDTIKAIAAAIRALKNEP